MSIRILAFIILTFVCQPSIAVEVIKKSSSGLCHDSGSKWYSRTKNFTAYSSMEKCFASGGKAYSGYSANPQPNDALVYNRMLFPHWLDDDSDCQDTRAETLIAQSSVPVTFKTARQCQVTSGSWYDPYTGNTYRSDDDLDIDHIIPLKWAYEHGASTWTEYARGAFANDADNLIAVSLSANRSKGDRGPTEWLPPNQAYRCDYLKEFGKVMDKYFLKMTASENRIYQRQLSACANN